MAKSLQDQLLKVGLADKKQLRKANSEKRKKNRQHLRNKNDSEDENKLRAKKAFTDKAERDRQLNRARQDEAERKSMAAQIRQLIKTNCLEKDEAGVPYNFVVNGKVKTIFVSESMRRQISCGRLGIVELEGCYEVVSLEIAEKIRTRNEENVVWLNNPKQTDRVEDDCYREYRVPDDLIW